MKRFGRNYTAIFILATALGACQHDGSGNGRANNNRSDDALNLLRSAVKQYPDSMRLRAQLASRLRENGDLSGALRETGIILAKDSLNPGILQFQAELLLDRKDTAEAIRAFEKIARANPESETLYSLAYLYAKTGNSVALRLCDTMIARMSRQHPKGDPYFIRGVYHLRTGNEDLALKSFNQSINIDHTMMQAYTEKGKLLFRRKQYKEAHSVFRLAATVSNTYADAYYWQGKCQQALGNNSEAADLYRKALALDPELTEAGKALKELKN